MPPASHQLDPAEDYLPSLTDGPTASSVSARRSNRPDSAGRKYLVDGAKFHFEFPFGRSKTKKKKEKDKKSDELVKLSKKTSVRSENTSQRHRRQSPEPNVSYPEAPEPPTATPFSEQRSSAHYTDFTLYGMDPGGQSGGPPPPPPPPPPPLRRTTLFDPSVHYPQSLDPRTPTGTIYEERTPPNFRPQSYSERQGHARGRGPSPILVNSTTSPRNSAHVRENSRQSVVFDLPPEPGSPQTTAGDGRAARPSSQSPVEESSYSRRYELREVERERARQLNRIADLEAQLDQTRDELSNAKVERESQRRSQEEFEPAQSQHAESQPSTAGATAGSFSPREQPRRPAAPAPQTPRTPQMPSRSFSHRTNDRHNRTHSGHTARHETAYVQAPAHNTGPSRHRTHRSHHSHPQIDPYSIRNTGQAGSRRTPEVEARIGHLESEISRLRRARRSVEAEMMRQAEADAYEDVLRGEQSSPRLQAYERLAGLDRDRDRDRIPWDPGTRDSYARARQRERDLEREHRDWERGYRQPHHTAEDMRAAFERINMGRNEVDLRPRARPWSWDRERRRY